VSETAPDRPAIRVFLSSTFQDLHAEREHLIKRVFPELRRICRERGVDFTEIDLRWGITEAEEQQGQVLRLCLEEIDRCRPYFLGILGRRYGWTPGPDDVARDLALLEKYPWVTDAVREGRSLTEIEIWHGVLRNPTMAERAFFYFQELGLEEAGPGSKGVRLREEIRRRGLPVREGFSDPTTLGQWVRDDLLQVIDRLYPADQAPDPYEQEHRGHEAFAHSRSRFYIPAPEIYAALDEHAAGAGLPLVLTGEAGVGKSALLAAWARDCRARNPAALVVSHFVGATAASGDPAAWMRRVMAELRRRNGWPEEVPAQPDEVRREFPDWLVRADGEPLILIIDALNQLGHPHETLSWLPARFPPHVRVLLSSLEGPSLQATRARGWPDLAVPRLDPERQGRLIRSFLGSYSKKLDEDQAAPISRSPACANPLFLLTVLDELRLSGSFEELDRRIDHYLAAPDLDVLFSRVLERMEADYGAGRVRELMTRLWAARRGLSEPELLEMGGLTRLDLSTLLFALDYHLRSSEGRVTFFHDHLREAIRARCLAGDAARAQAHRRIGEYFMAQPPSDRRLDELPWQWLQAGEWERLRDCIVEMEAFLALVRDERRDDLLVYWQALEGRHDLVDTLLQSLGEYQERIIRSSPFAALKAELSRSAPLVHLGGLETPAEAQAAFAAMELASFLHLVGCCQAADRLLDDALERLDRLVGVDRGLIAETLYHQAELRHSAGDYARAETTLRHAITLLASEGQETSGRLALVSNALAGVFLDQGRFVEAEETARRALHVALQGLGPDDRVTANCRHTLASAYLHLGRFREAERLFRETLAVLESRFGPDHMGAAAAAKGLATALENQERLDEAEPLYRRCLGTWQKHFGEGHPFTAQGWNDLALLLQRKGDLQAARPLFQRSIAAYEQALGADHPHTATAIHNFAALLLEEGDPAGAQEHFRRALAIRERVQPGHFVTATTLAGLAVTYLAQGDQDTGDGLFCRAAEMMAAAAPGHPASVDSLVNVAIMWANRGDLERGLSYARRAHSSGLNALGRQHPTTQRAGEILEALEEAAG
jgi:tetratricopeptide (TPR) repeat protein